MVSMSVFVKTPQPSKLRREHVAPLFAAPILILIVAVCPVVSSNVSLVDIYGWNKWNKNTQISHLLR